MRLSGAINKGGPMANLSAGNNSGLLIGLLVIVLIAVGGYAFYQHQNNNTISIETPAGSASIKAQ